MLSHVELYGYLKIKFSDSTVTPQFMNNLNYVMNYLQLLKKIVETSMLLEKKTVVFKIFHLKNSGMCGFFEECQENVLIENKNEFLPDCLIIEFCVIFSFKKSREICYKMLLSLRLSSQISDSKRSRKKIRKTS